jgi:hypothetical protein
MKIKSITTFIICLCIVYGVFKASDLLFGSPFHFSIEKESDTRMVVEGNAKYSKEILINGSETMVTTTGDFKYEFSPTPGINTISIQTKDTFGNSQEKVHSFVYDSFIYNNGQSTKTAQSNILWR